MMDNYKPVLYTTRSLNEHFRLLSDGLQQHEEYFRVLDLEGNQIDEGLTYLEALALYGEDQEV